MDSHKEEGKVERGGGTLLCESTSIGLRTLALTQSGLA